MLPNGNFELFFQLGNSTCSIYSNKYNLDKSPCVFMGYHDLYFDSTLITNSYNTTFTVVFKLLGFFRLFGFKDSELTNNITRGENIYKEFTYILEALNEIKNFDIYCMKMVFERSVKSRLKPICEKFAWLFEAVNHIKYKQGMVSVVELCNSFDVTRRKLERTFNDILGISPYGYTNIIRANNVLSKLANGNSLLQTALEFGYYDQAHFIKDFKRIIGCPPKAYLNCTPHELLNKSIANRIYMPKLPVIKKARS